ncbi:MAG: threonine--tRNA ligase [Verrucomicrobia bacterium]|nr:threonine--tRNA ligase [Verrucomicrobiota bacterium]
MQDELQEASRKTPGQRARMSEVERLRHSCAHVMATAIARLWPDAQFAAGPPVENGFYYDVDLAHRISPADFEKIEAEMRAVTKANQPFERIVVTRAEALEYARRGRLAALSDRPAPSRFKLDILEGIPDGEPISFFRNGEFIDLCAGPHVMRTGNVGAFKLTHVASAYYKNDEKNPQLQRIYGTAFKNKTEMEAWFTMLEEAKKRDHRKIGAEMGLFAFDPDYTGPGLPLWLPKGGAMIEELEKLARETEFAAGYVRVRTPHIAREKMYLTSGHLPYYAESMFPPMELIEHEDQGARALHDPDDKFDRVLKSLQYEQHSPKEVEELVGKILGASAEAKHADADRYYLKAMNCPHHHRIFAAEPRSYRDLPLRLAEHGCCYRYEQSGELFGLMRVRSLNMNDAHIYCTTEQFAAEFNAVNEMYLKYFKIFGLEKYQMRFSTSAPEGMGKKYVDEPALWKQTEDMVRDVLKNSGINFVEAANEAAFYGPKIDVQVWSAIGREFSIATNQVDFAVPKRFGLVYRDRDNTEKTPLCIHRAPLGTHERFIGFLIEHYAGNFPLWLAPEQVRVLTIGDDAALVDYARGIVNELRANMVRVETDFGADKINGKVQRAEQSRVHTMLVIGPRDMAANAVSVRVHGKGNQGARPRTQAVADILAAIKGRTN